MCGTALRVCVLEWLFLAIVTYTCMLATPALGSSKAVTDAPECAALRLPTRFIRGNGNRVRLARRRLEQLWWLHAPKTGTSFGNTIYHYACPKLPPYAMMNSTWPVGKNRSMMMISLMKEYPVELYCEKNALFPIQRLSSRDLIQKKMTFADTFAGHYPLTAYRGGMPPTGVALFRSPVSRLISAFHHFKHSYGMPPKHRARLVESVKTPLEFAKFPGIAGCQAKMLAGFKCGYPVRITPRIVGNALHNLGNLFAFVALQDYWDLSICLFHGMFGGLPTNASFFNSRPRESQEGLDNETKTLDDSSITDDGSISDPADFIIFITAAQMFKRRLLDYEFSIPEDLDQHIIPLEKLCQRFPNHDLYCDKYVQDTAARLLHEKG